jgi:type 1 fimbriae regulatory protein FimE
MAKAKKPPPKAMHPPPRKPRNEDVRGKEHLTEEEVDQLRKTAGRLGRYGHRDATMILVGFRHGLRVTELVKLRWDQIDVAKKTIHVRRLKGSKSGTHDVSQVEVAALKKMAKSAKGPYVFPNERGGHLTRSAFTKILARAGRESKPPIAVHPHMLRHACGFHLINEGFTTRRVQDHLGHRSIVVTERYTALVADPSKKLWDD